MAFAEGTTTEQGKQDFKYNGKELDRTHGLNWYDYSARYLDNAIGRTPTQDPMSEKFYSISPYVYVANNPMRLIDPDGRVYTDYVDKDGVRQVKTNDATPDRIETSLPEVKVEGKAIPKEGNGVVAVGVSITKESQAGVSTAGTPVNVIHITKGADAGKTIVLAGGEVGMGTIGTSASMSITRYSYVGDINNLKAATFEGKSTVSGGSVDLGVSVGTGISEATDPKGGILTGHTFSIGMGISLSAGDFNIRKSFSKPLK